MNVHVAEDGADECCTGRFPASRRVITLTQIYGNRNSGQPRNYKRTGGYRLPETSALSTLTDSLVTYRLGPRWNGPK
ncbi:hypothetical protein SKAU_G00070680 [Synaphobranchus kaupii]|uniref:Uncharacterized protein n=1 Tax=Synaphobranchus kaupii TaxID=118154 RepID=A0A9Q1JB93_SYNKA|nr:hypothetical protein SKAU_G00070680 [Synaphobranchus kaupii]